MTLRNQFRELFLSMMPGKLRRFLFSRGIVKLQSVDLRDTAPRNAIAAELWVPSEQVGEIVIGMTCWRLDNGGLIPVHLRPHVLNCWTPPEGWKLKCTMRIEDRQRRIDFPQAHVGDNG